LFLATSAETKGTLVRSVSSMAAQKHRTFPNGPLFLKTILHFLIRKTFMTFRTLFRKQVGFGQIFWLEVLPRTGCIITPQGFCDGMVANVVVNLYLSW
jgi:hypothetical protein